MSSQSHKEGKPEPTKAELEILQILWQYGPSTVRFVNDKQNELRDVQYTSTLKQIQIMTQKELLIRTESGGKHIFAPSVEEDKTKGYMLDRFLSTIYNGSASRLIQQLLGNRTTSKKELDMIRDILDKLENK